jgi:hypothetical protein
MALSHKSMARRSTQRTYRQQMDDTVEIMRRVQDPAQRRRILSATMQGEQLLEAVERLQREGLL